MNLTFPLLSDHPEFKTVRAYGILNEPYRIALRSYFLIGTNGTIRWNHVSPGPPLQNEEVLERIRNALEL